MVNGRRTLKSWIRLPKRSGTNGKNMNSDDKEQEKLRTLRSDGPEPSPNLQYSIRPSSLSIRPGGQARHLAPHAIFSRGFVHAPGGHVLTLESFMQTTSSPRLDRGSGPFSPAAPPSIRSGLHQVKTLAFVWPPAAKLIGGG